MPKYKVINPVDVNGEIYKTGELTADAETVQPLIDSGSLMLSDDQAEAGGGNEENKTALLDAGDSDPRTNDLDTNSNSDTANAAGSENQNAAENVVDSENQNPNSAESHQQESGTAILVGGVTKEGRIVALTEWKMPELKKLATELEVKGAANLNKQALVDAITAVEFSAEQLDA